jgi:hypothetical protein
MAIDIFEPRTMRAALKEMKPARSFLKSLFFRTSETSLTEHVDVDTMVGTRRLAPFTNPQGPGKFTERTGFTTSTVTPPMVAPKRSITVPDIQTRTPGEHIYSDRSPDDRAREILGGDLADLDDMITRREEWMCAKALFDSDIDIVGDDVNYTITFTRDAGQTKGLLGATDRWTHADSNPPEQIRGWRRDCVKLTGSNPDILIVSTEAANALLSNVKVQAQLDTLRAELGQIAPELRDSGATYIGRFAGTGIDIFAYDEWFIDPADGLEYPMVPAKKVLLGATNARTAMRYGAVGVASGDSIGLVADSRVPESWIEREPAVRWLKVSSRPLPVPIQNNAFLTAQVVA